MTAQPVRFRKYATAWRYGVLTVLIAAGIALRLFLAGSADRELRWDSHWYFEAGQMLIRGVLPAECCFHGSGYPVFIAAILAVFGSDAVDAVRLAQVFLDISTACVLWMAVRRSSTRMAADTVLGAYLLNPFSSGYTGVIMTEVLALHLVAWMIYAASYCRRNLAPKWVFIMTGVFMGLAVWVKPGFLWISLLLILLMLGYYASSWKARLFHGLAAVSGFLLASSFSLVAYGITYGRPGPVPPYGMGIGTMLYLNYYLEPLPEIAGVAATEHPEWTRTVMEYHHLFLANKHDQTSLYNRTYAGRFITQLPEMWLTFIAHTVRNFFLFWDKRYLLIYRDPWYPTYTPLIRMANFVYLAFGALGLGLELQKPSSLRWGMAVLTVVMVVYMGVMFPLISNVSRHSLPLYGPIVLWAGIGVAQVANRFFRQQLVRSERKKG